MSQSSTRILSSMTNLPEAELKRRLESMKDVKTGQVRGLRQLDAALAQAVGGVAKSTLDQYASLSQRAETAHVIESPEAAFTRAGSDAGYAKAAAEPASPQVSAVLDKAKTSAIKRMQMAPIVDDAMPWPGGNANNPIGGPASMQDLNNLEDKADSRQDDFERLKNEMNRISQITQMITNTMQAMHEQAMTAIRNAKA